MCVCVCGGGGGSGPQTVLLNDLIPFIVFVQTRVCLAYLFYKTLRLSIIKVKPIAIVKNHKINETMYGNLANEHFKMSQMNRKHVYFVQDTV